MSQEAIGMLEEFLLYRIRVHTAGHEVMPLVAKHADKFGRECLIQHLDHLQTIGRVGARHRAFGDVPARVLAYLLEICCKRLHSDYLIHWTANGSLRRSPPATTSKYDMAPGAGFGKAR